jgi:hypothetical protein
MDLFVNFGCQKSSKIDSIASRNLNRIQKPYSGETL